MAVTTGLSIGVWFLLIAFAFAEGSTKPQWLSGSVGRRIALTWSWLWTATAVAGLFFWWTTVTGRIVNGQIAVPQAPDAPIWVAYIHGIIVALVMQLVGWLPRWLIDYRTNQQTVPKLTQDPHRSMTADGFGSEIASEDSVIAARSMPNDGANARSKQRPEAKPSPSKFSAAVLWFIGDLTYCGSFVVALPLIAVILFTGFKGAADSVSTIVVLLLFPVFFIGLGWAFRFFLRKLTLKRCWRAAVGGDASAQNWLGHAYANGRGVQKDRAEAIAWWRKAVEQGFADAQFELARIYEAGLGGGQDFANATALYTRAAEQGHRHARKGLAEMYAEGRCDPRDNTTAAYWYERLSKRKETIRLFVREPIFLVLVPLLFYVSGLLVIVIGAFGLARHLQNPGAVLAIIAALITIPIIIIYIIIYRLIRKAPKPYHLPAQALLAVVLILSPFSLIWFDSKDSSQNLAQRLEQIDPSSAQAFLRAVDDIERGAYGPALQVIRPLAEKGHVEAQTLLGVLYSEGRAVPQNDVEAVKWYRLAAEQNDAFAQSGLSALYYLGRGVPQDYVEAYKWASLAAAQGYKKARDRIDFISSKMSATQITEAERLAREWLAEHPQ